MAAEVAKVSGTECGPSSVLRWERNESEPSLRAALAIHVITGWNVPLSSLLVRR